MDLTRAWFRTVLRHPNTSQVGTWRPYSRYQIDKLLRAAVKEERATHVARRRNRTWMEYFV